MVLLRGERSVQQGRGGEGGEREGGAKIMFGNVNRSNRLSERETTRVLMLIQDNDRLKAELKELRKQVGACIWWERSPGDSYTTACQHDAHFVNENAREQGYRYCPWCSRRIEYKEGGRR